MGITTLYETFLIRCVIFKGVNYCSQTEIGINFTNNSRGSSENQQECIKDNLEHQKASF